MEGKGIIFVISAPSGTGKTTLISQLIGEVPGLRFSVSYTTRRPRPGEENGKDYFFVSQDHFLEMVEKGKFVEWASVHGDLYGTPRESLTPPEGVDMILDIDPQGAEQIKRTCPDAVFIFLLPPSFQELERRLRQRGKDSEETIRQRLMDAVAELKKIDLYDYVVVNDDIEKALDCLKAIVKAERCKRTRMLKEVTTWLG